MLQTIPHGETRVTNGSFGYIDHISQAKPGIQVFPHRLYVVTMISNPSRFRSRYELYRAFEKYVADSGAILLTVEVAYGERLFEITDPTNPWHLQLRTDTELWHKENALNLGIAHLSKLVPNWGYVAWIDADIKFAREDWAQETLHQLQHYKVVQMFSQNVDMSDNFEIIPNRNPNGFVYQWFKTYRWGKHHDIPDEEKYKTFLSGDAYGGYGGYSAELDKTRFMMGHSGFAWAATRQAIDDLGGLLDTSICGSNDYHMAMALVANVMGSASKQCHPGFLETLHLWEKRCIDHIIPKIGFVPGHIFHYWHGAKANRRYNDRWRILVDNQYNYYTDIKRDAQGLFQFAGNKPMLELDLMQYFRIRNEDAPYIPPEEE